MSTALSVDSQASCPTYVIPAFLATRTIKPWSAPPTSAEIDALERRRLENVQDLERLQADTNEHARNCLWDKAKQRDERNHGRGLAIGGDLVKTKHESESKLHPRWDGPFIIRDLTDEVHLPDSNPPAQTVQWLSPRTVCSDSLGACWWMLRAAAGAEGAEGLRLRVGSQTLS